MTEFSLDNSYFCVSNACFSLSAIAKSPFGMLNSGVAQEQLVQVLRCAYKFG